METGKRARALAQAPGFELPRVDVRQFALHALLFVFCLTSALVLTYSRLEITRTRYEINDLHQRRQTLLAETDRLRVEAAALGSPRRIEKLAREAGFTYPSQDSLVILDD
ncbi:MAG: cell division protein FtsL [Deltaproteobacteria bacterium]|nr:cell division protein FtsL [Deltaproteobacteria bacterium]